MVFNFPRIRFAETNTIVEQVRHIRSELEELEESIVLGECRARVAEEAMDLLHSTETFIRMLHEEGLDPSSIKTAIIRKNRVRNYYE